MALFFETFQGPSVNTIVAQRPGKGPRLGQRTVNAETRQDFGKFPANLFMIPNSSIQRTIQKDEEVRGRFIGS